MEHLGGWECGDEKRQSRYFRQENLPRTLKFTTRLNFKSVFKCCPLWSSFWNTALVVNLELFANSRALVTYRHIGYIFNLLEARKESKGSPMILFNFYLGMLKENKNHKQDVTYFFVTYLI